jgi:cytochrome c peroxidase
MKNTYLFLILFLALVLFLPLSNLLGLSGENEPIIAVSGSSANFVQVSKIFQNKCVDCHSPGMTRMPFYSKFPVAKQLMAKDIENASARLILSKQLYSGETRFSPLMLARLEGVIRHNSMPPVLYLSMHWTDSLTVEERNTIQAWIAEERAKSPWSADSAQAQKGESVQPLPLKVELDPKKVALGQQLFFDRSLSGDDTLNCASCHNLTKGGTDQAKVATGIRGQQGPINSPTVYNALYNIAQFWDGRAKDLREQAAGPVANPTEMGANWDDVVEKLKHVDAYRVAFNELYSQQGLTKDTVIDAIVDFEQSLVTSNSRFDQYLRGNNEILAANEKQGYELFKDNCASCHFGPALGGLSFEKMGVKQDYFKLRGGPLAEADNGRFNVTKQEKDRHFFKVPTLRNVELTQPYFHDGSIDRLDDAVRIMAKVQQDRKLTTDEINQIVAFLKTLTGEYKGKLITQIKDEDVH